MGQCGGEAAGRCGGVAVWRCGGVAVGDWRSVAGGHVVLRSSHLEEARPSKRAAHLEDLHHRALQLACKVRTRPYPVVGGTE